MESKWHPLMVGFGIPLDKWRRHNQRLSLTRAHAWLVALDGHIVKAFDALCQGDPDAIMGNCFSGEYTLCKSHHWSTMHCITR